MMEGAVFRGQPLLLLGGLVLGWFALRAALWQPPFETSRAFKRVAETVSPPMIAPRREAVAPPVRTPPLQRDPPRSVAVATVATDPSVPAVQVPLTLLSRSPVVETSGPVALRGEEAPPPALTADLATAQLTAPGIPAAPPMLAAAPPRGAEAAASRWSADGWLLLRRDATTPFLPGRPSYGRSQAGAVVRYRLAPASPLRPQAYLRASSALAGAREQELAAGVSARPLAALPLRVAVEVRVSETGQGTRLRPAAYAVTEFTPLRLPLGMRAEAYAQGGYVGGDYATTFVDGQARIERPLVQRGELELSAGLAGWGGAQRDAARLDVGPSATLSFRLGPSSSRVRGRLAADYRFRVAGRAEPASGPALTLSAGF